MLNRARVSTLLAEFLGTATLVMVALVLSETTAVSYFIATSVAATLAVVYMMFSAISGAHVNPAITFGLWTARRIRTLPAVGYILAQLLGGVAAWQLYQYFTDHTLAVRSSSFSLSIFVAEAVGTMILSLGFAAAVTRGFDTLQSALTYGTSLFVGILVAATAAAAYLNPALALGIRSFDWTYALAPLVGALVGVNLYTYLFTDTPLPKVRTTVIRKK